MFVQIHNCIVSATQFCLNEEENLSESLSHDSLLAILSAVVDMQRQSGDNTNYKVSHPRRDEPRLLPHVHLLWLLVMCAPFESMKQASNCKLHNSQAKSSTRALAPPNREGNQLEIAPKHGDVFVQESLGVEFFWVGPEGGVTANGPQV